MTEKGYKGIFQENENILYPHLDSSYVDVCTCQNCTPEICTTYYTFKEGKNSTWHIRCVQYILISFSTPSRVWPKMGVTLTLLLKNWFQKWGSATCKSIITQALGWYQLLHGHTKWVKARASLLFFTLY